MYKFEGRLILVINCGMQGFPKLEGINRALTVRRGIAGSCSRGAMRLPAVEPERDS